MFSLGNLIRLHIDLKHKDKKGCEFIFILLNPFYEAGKHFSVS
jgi:hypothetical protein